MKRKHIVIVGGGFSGAALALEIVAASPEATQVTVVDRFGGFGPGLAYSTTDPAHLLNVHAERMSALPDAPDDFLTWLRERGLDAPRDMYAQRAAYGDYLTQRMRITTQFAEQGALDLMRADVVACKVNKSGVNVELASGAQLDADQVVLALGNLPAVRPFDTSGLDAARYKPSPWEPAAIAAIPPEADVLLVGAGLTMFDVALSLTRTPRVGKIYALSRRGLIPRTQAENLHGHSTEKLDPPLQLSEALHYIRREVAAAEKRGEPWQSVMNRVRAQTPELWRRLPPEAQQRFLRHLRVWWDVHRHRAAPYAAIEITRLRSAGQLVVIGGRIERTEPTPHGVSVAIRPRGQAATRTIEVGCIVNCTGASVELSRSTDPLIRQLIAEGTARVHPTGLGFDVADTGELIGADGKPQKRLRAIGPPTQGAWWEITAVPEIRKRATELARDLVLAPR